MPSVAIRVPISLNRHFVTMTEMLARSITRFAPLAEWRLELTVSRDTDLDLDSDLLAWTADYPVSARWLDRGLFAHDSWWGTAIQRHLIPTDMDVVAFMDADTLVAGSLEDAFASVLEIDGVAGRTAWAPPDVDLEALLADVADAADLRRHVYAGYGTRMLAPKHCPPYFNFGFVLASRNAVERMAPAMMLDMEESLVDPRVLHDCPRQAEAFDKSRAMASLEAVRRLMDGPERQRGALVLQRVRKDLV